MRRVVRNWTRRRNRDVTASRNGTTANDSSSSLAFTPGSSSRRHAVAQATAPATTSVSRDPDIDCQRRILCEEWTQQLQQKAKRVVVVLRGDNNGGDRDQHETVWCSAAGSWSSLRTTTRTDDHDVPTTTTTSTNSSNQPVHDATDAPVPSWVHPRDDNDWTINDMTLSSTAYCCAICLSSYQPDAVVVECPTCESVFHYPCAMDWCRTTARRQCRKQHPHPHDALTISTAALPCPCCRQDLATCPLYVAPNNVVDDDDDDEDTNATTNTDHNMPLAATETSANPYTWFSGALATRCNY